MHSEQRMRIAQLRVRRIHEVARQVSAEKGYFRRDDELSHESESSSIQKLDGPQQTAMDSEEDEVDNRVKCDSSANEDGDSTRYARKTDGAIFFHFLLNVFLFKCLRQTRFYACTRILRLYKFL